MTVTHDIVAKLWNLCNVLKDDGVTYHQYVTELTYLLFLKMAKETGHEDNLLAAYRWDDLDWYSARQEGLGDLYEGLLEKNANEKKSGAGQYFTPRVLINVMVDLMQPRLGEVIQDPAAGTAGFLIAASHYVQAHNDVFATKAGGRVDRYHPGQGVSRGAGAPGPER